MRLHINAFLDDHSTVNEIDFSELIYIDRFIN